jgi:hypothetical protein
MGLEEDLADGITNFNYPIIIDPEPLEKKYLFQGALLQYFTDPGLATKVTQLYSSLPNLRNKIDDLRNRFSSFFCKYRSSITIKGRF